MIETIKSIILDFLESRLETGVPRRLRIETVHCFFDKIQAAPGR